MSVEIVMPAMEMAQEAATLVQWLKAEGAPVHKGEPLMVIETDKVSVEIEAPASGILANVTAHAGDAVPVGRVIAALLEEREPATANSASAAVVASPVARRIAAEHNLDLAAITTTSGRIEKADVLAYLQAHQTPPTLRPSRLKAASPKARRLAFEGSIPLENIAGSGEQGAVLVSDIQKVLAQPPVSVTEPRAEPAAVEIEYRVIPLTNVRRKIAERTQASYQTAPHIALTVTADMSETLRLMERLAPSVQSQTGHALTITALLAKFISAALQKHPAVNAHVLENEIHEFDTVHLGIAVALADGLIVPVMRHAERKGLAALQSELAELSQRARDHILKPSEVKGSTFTISNLGMYGIEQFTAILNSPEAGILSVGKITETPVGVNGQVVLRPMMQMTLNADHRAVDGATGARFMQSLQQRIENPYLLLE